MCIASSSLLHNLSPPKFTSINIKISRKGEWASPDPFFSKHPLKPLVDPSSRHLYQLIHPHDTSISWSILTTLLSVDPSSRHLYQLIHPHATAISWSIFTTPLSVDPSSRHLYQLIHLHDTSISWSILTIPLSVDPSSRHLYQLIDSHYSNLWWCIDGCIDVVVVVGQ